MSWSRDLEPKVLYRSWTIDMTMECKHTAAVTVQSPVDVNTEKMDISLSKDRPLEHQTNPLLLALAPVEERIERFKAEARDFYLKVMLSVHTCEQCGGGLEMIGRSLCVCRDCAERVDPTTAFQRSLCCGAVLVRKRTHYACSGCGRIAPSRFLFNERLFDEDYFREMMRSSRERARRKKEALRQAVLENRSEHLVLDQEPDLGAIPGLAEALNAFLNSSSLDLEAVEELTRSFDLGAYRRHILECLGWGATPFAAIPQLQGQVRLDRVFRFVTLVFMDQAGEVFLDQEQGELLVQRVFHEAD